MKTTTRRWLLVATAATALVGCSSGENPEGVSPDESVAPIDGDSSPTPEALLSGEVTEEEAAVFAKYDIDAEDAGKAFAEMMAWGMDAGADATEEEGTRESLAILAKYGIDPEDYGMAMAEMISAGAEEPDQMDANAAEAQPLDGGEYTWPNGIRLAVRVVKTEPWGVTDDYCGDGSCGVSSPDDLRWVLRYDVTVPESFPGAFDPYSCPGQLHLVDGNDDDALIGVAGADYKSIDGSILPGATKYGQEEYSIESAALGGEFYIESSCGDTEFGGDVAYFRGVIG